MKSSPPTPRLTIGIPVYNGADLLAATLDSFQAQTFRDFEIVVSDNASTDATPEVVAAYRARDPRIRYIRNDRNIGGNANFCRVAAEGTAPLFKWAANDDLYAPTYLERCIEAIDASPGVVLAHTDTAFIDEAGKPFTLSETPGVWIDPDGGSFFAADPVDLATSDSPLRRFSHVVFASLWGTHMFGVVPRQAMHATRLLQDMPSSDRPFLAELALLGRFATHPEPLYQKRLHPGMSLMLSTEQTIAYVSGNSENYNKRARQLQVFMRTPVGKPIGWLGRNACRCIVLAYGAHAAMRTLRGQRHESIWPKANRSTGRGGLRMTAGT